MRIQMLDIAVCKGFAKAQVPVTLGVLQCHVTVTEPGQALSEALDRAAAERLASLFLMLIERTEHINGAPQTRFDLPMSRLDIADYLGLTKETVSRMLAVLRGKRLIRLESQDRVEVLDRGGLAEL
ncbi:MAG: helix-turn-helix domain-containing protein, partial [Rhizobiales bacterium]|nr:helix-turn-helix domain-containing protein [Hyphomicrobiales bacterium]